MRKPVLLSMLASLILFVGACEDESDKLTEPSGFSVGTTVESDAMNPPVDPTDDPPVDPPEYPGEDPCDWTPTSSEILATLAWEEFEGTIQPGIGGFLYAPSVTWGPGAAFGIQVPPGALPAGVGPTDFTMRFPTKQSYKDWENDPDVNCGKGLPLILELAPSGMVFLEPVTVYATYMPWTNMTVEEFEDMWVNSYPPGPYELLWVTENRGVVSFACKVWHFSRWSFGCPTCVPDPDPNPE